MNESTYRKNITQMISKIHNLRSLKLIYEYVEYLMLHNEADA